LARKAHGAKGCWEQWLWPGPPQQEVGEITWRIMLDAGARRLAGDRTLECCNPRTWYVLVRGSWCGRGTRITELPPCPRLQMRRQRQFLSGRFVQSFRVIEAQEGPWDVLEQVRQGGGG